MQRCTNEPTAKASTKKEDDEHRNERNCQKQRICLFSNKMAPIAIATPLCCRECPGHDRMQARVRLRSETRPGSSNFASWIWTSKMGDVIAERGIVNRHVPIGWILSDDGLGAHFCSLSLARPSFVRLVCPWTGRSPRQIFQPRRF